MSAAEVAVRALYLLSTLLAFGLAALLWRSRDSVGALPLSVMNASVGLWMGCLFVTSVAPERIALWTVRFVYLGVGGTFASFFVFALAYTGRKQYITRPVLGLLAVHPITALLLAVVNPNSVFFTTIEPVAVASELNWGPAFWAHAAYSYTLGMVSIGIILSFLFRSRHSLYRKQALAIAAGTLLPSIFISLHVFTDIWFNTSAVGAIIMSVLFTVAIYHYQLTDLMPIARAKVVENVRDGMFVVDTDHRIVSINEAAQQLFALTEKPVGKRIPEILSAYPTTKADYEELTAPDAERERTVEFDDRFLNVRSEPIEDARGRHIGWLLLVQNITDRVERERELEQKNERLDRFASMISHDLRNPLNVAQLRTELITNEYDDDNAETVQEALERMETMIDEMLTLARGGHELDSTERNRLAPLVEQSWENVQTDNAKLESSLEDMTVEADANRLLHVFENLFRNSVEHGSTSPDSQARQDTAEHGSTSPDSQARQDTAEHGSTSPGSQVRQDTVEDTDPSLVVRVGHLEDRDGFYVEDDGIGIPEGDRDQVFDPGFTTDKNGSGYGLAIAREIVEAHGWTITVTESDGGGARFEIAT